MPELLGLRQSKNTQTSLKNCLKHSLALCFTNAVIFWWERRWEGNRWGRCTYCGRLGFDCPACKGKNERAHVVVRTNSGLDILVTRKRGNGKALEAAWAARPAHAQQVAAWNAAVAEREKEHVARVRMGCKERVKMSKGTRF